MKKLGYRRYFELKIKINEELENTQDTVFDNLPVAITQALQLINYERLLKIADLMKNAHTIHFLGVGESWQECEMMVKHVCLDKHAILYGDYYEIEYRGDHCNENDLLIFISVCGETQRLVEVARKACNNNCIDNRSNK